MGASDQSLVIIKKRGSILPQMRHQLLRQAVNSQTTHLLFLDTDQTFPSNTLHRLLQWRKPIVACNVAVKKVPSCPTARGFERQPVYTLAGATGLKKVWRVGCGVMLIETDAIRSIPPPWFLDKWVSENPDYPDAEDYQGEDWGFCEVLEANRIPIYIDQGLSWEIGHIGEKVFTHSDVVVEGGQLNERGLILPPAGLVGPDGRELCLTQ
jgi:hypothetical protein